MEEREILGLFPLLLKDAAKFWLDSFTDEHKESIRSLRRQFLKRFEREDINMWKDVAAVWTTTQSPTQSVDAYILDQKSRKLFWHK